MKQQPSRWLNLARISAIVIWIGTGAFLITHRTMFTPQTIQSISPENLISEILFLLLLYAGKTLSLVFPLKVPQFAAGLLLPIFPAVLVNLLGIAVSTAVGYGMGRLLGGDSVHRITEKISALLRF